MSLVIDNERVKFILPTCETIVSQAKHSPNPVAAEVTFIVWKDNKLIFTFHECA